MKSLFRLYWSLATAAILATALTPPLFAAPGSEVIARRIDHYCPHCGVPIYANLRDYGRDSRGRPIRRWAVSTHYCIERSDPHRHCGPRNCGGQHGENHDPYIYPRTEYGNPAYGPRQSTRDAVIEALSNAILNKLQDR